MTPQTNTQAQNEFDFALIVAGVPELTDTVQDALFEAGCDDATPSIQHGLLYLEFSRRAPTIKDAIITAIRDVTRAGIGANVLQVDECNLVTQSEIARRIGRSRQLVHQFMTGQRGPGGFPPPACQITDRAPLWAWCAVSQWLAINNLIRPEISWNASVIEAVNHALDRNQLPPGLLRQVTADLAAAGITPPQSN
jgi:hypothetical protein